MRQVSLPGVGTGPHTLKLTFLGSRIQVYYDGVQLVDFTDSGFDGRAAYLRGGISADQWTDRTSYTMTVDNVVVSAP